MQWKERASEQIPASNAADRVDAVQRHRIQMFWLHRVALWYVTLETYFKFARSASDELKYSATIGNLDETILAQVKDIVVDQPETGRYERIKSELVKRLADSDGTEMKKLLETEEIGDWMSSQYYRHLKKLSLMVSDEFVLTPWKIHLPVDVQLVLAVATDSKPKALTELADRVH